MCWLLLLFAVCSVLLAAALFCFAVCCLLLAVCSVLLAAAAWVYHLILLAAAVFCCFLVVCYTASGDYNVSHVYDCLPVFGWLPLIFVGFRCWYYCSLLVAAIHFSHALFVTCCLLVAIFWAPLLVDVVVFVVVICCSFLIVKTSLIMV